MPTFQIHDDDTGFKLLVEGDEAPTESEADDLVQQELSFLRTNLYHGASNKFMLDVGPLSDVRRSMDRNAAVINRIDAFRSDQARRIAAIDKAKERISTLKPEDIVKENGVALFERLYEEELGKMPAITQTPLKSATDAMGMRLDPNTLLLVAHGQPTGGLTTEGGQNFTLHNIAQLLGAKSNAIHNIINTACYGGKCSPTDFQAAFPNVTNVRSADLTMPNTISVNALSRGDYFVTNTTPGIWKRYGTNWFPELPDYDSVIANESKETSE